MMLATAITLLKNLGQIEYNGHYYDFHNNYTCERITYTENRDLCFDFKKELDEILIRIKFTDAIITKVEFFNIKGTESLTLDNLYRGRVEKEGELVELSENVMGYFYCEFYEGQKLEFWAKSIHIESKE
jgi:hypothetical protein